MYNFKKNAKLYIVENGNKHSIAIYSDLSASQTFDEQGYAQKTLHTPLDLHEKATITKAAPASFSFTVPILDMDTTPIWLTLVSTYSSGSLASFDIYVESDNILYKLEKSVFERVTFNITMGAVLTASLSGSAGKFINVTGSGIPGTPVVPLYKNYTRVRRLATTVAGTSFDSIAAINIELSNDLQWTPNSTLQESLTGSIIYPQSYILAGRQISGSITQFLTSSNLNTGSDTSITASIDLSVYTDDIQVTPFLQFSLPSTVFTRRVNLDELVTRVYDYRLNSNLTIVKPLYKGV